MSLELFREDQNGHRHSIMVGEKSAWCMDCGKIVIEYNDNEDFKKLMNPIIDDDC